MAATNCHAQIVEFVSPGDSAFFEIVEYRNAGKHYEFTAILCEEPEGGFSIYAERFPGIVSQGETEEEARQNIREAFLGILDELNQQGENLQSCAGSITTLAPNCTRIRIEFDA